MTNISIFYVFYGLIQGITEFIPISSSGHLNILEIFSKGIESRNYLYETSAHFASLLALLLYLLANKHFSKSNIKCHWPIVLPILNGYSSVHCIKKMTMMFKINF